MLKDSQFSSHILHLSQLQSVNHKTLDEYRDRLKTYEVNVRRLHSLVLFISRQDSLWFGKPDQLSAIECARRGWACQANDSIECINCHAQIRTKLPSVLRMDQCKSTECTRVRHEYRFRSDTTCIDTYARSLVDAHHQYCVWRFMIIPESIVQLTDIYSSDTVNRLLQVAEEFLTRFNAIDIVGPLTTVRLPCSRDDSIRCHGISLHHLLKVFQIEATDFDLLSSSHLNEPRLLSAFKIVVFCWILKGTALICDKCCREVPLDSKHLTFDPIGSHRTWCPVLTNSQWKTRIGQIENILFTRSRSQWKGISTNHNVSISIDSPHVCLLFSVETRF